MGGVYMKKLLAFHNDEAVKNKYLERVLAHQKADEIVQGIYWENGKGCAVGCTIEGSDHLMYEKKLGIPSGIAYLEDTIFEGLSNTKAKLFPSQFLKAIPVGSDLSLVTAKFVIWQFEDKKHGLKNIKEIQEDEEIYGFCKEVVNLYKRKIIGDMPTKNEFWQLYLKIGGARDGAWAWARAWAGAGGGAGAGAWAGTRAWAWAGAWVDQYDIMAKQLIKLLKEDK
jgi:hypothetical protein